MSFLKSACSYHGANWRRLETSHHYFHRDSFEVYRDSLARKERERFLNDMLGVSQDGSDKEPTYSQQNKRSSPLSQFFGRARKAWSTLPCSAAARARLKERSRSFNPNEEKPRSGSHEPKHAHFSDYIEEIGDGDLHSESTYYSGV